MVESTEREVFDIEMDALKCISDMGWWIGVLYVAMVNVVAAAVTDEVQCFSILLWMVVSSRK